MEGMKAFGFRSEEIFYIINPFEDAGFKVEHSKGSRFPDFRIYSKKGKLVAGLEHKVTGSPPRDLRVDEVVGVAPFIIGEGAPVVFIIVDLKNKQTRALGVWWKNMKINTIHPAEVELRLWNTLKKALGGLPLCIPDWVKRKRRYSGGAIFKTYYRQLPEGVRDLISNRKILFFDEFSTISIGDLVRILRRVG